MAERTVSKTSTRERSIAPSRRRATRSDARKVSRRLLTNLKKLDDVTKSLADLEESSSGEVKKENLLMEQEELQAKVDSLRERLEIYSKTHSGYIRKNRKLEKSRRGITE